MANSNQKPPSKFADDSTSLFPPPRRIDFSSTIMGTGSKKPIQSPEETFTELVCILAGVGAVTIGGIIVYFTLRILSWLATH